MGFPYPPPPPFIAPWLGGFLGALASMFFVYCDRLTVPHNMDTRITVILFVVAAGPTLPDPELSVPKSVKHYRFGADL